MADRLLGVLRQQRLELALGSLVLETGLPGTEEVQAYAYGSASG
jgi:hypothetical protein